MRHKAESWSKWRGAVAEQKESGESVAAFCRERGLPVSQMFAWKKRLREAEAGPAQFVEVAVEPSAAPLPLLEPARSVAIEVRLTGGRSLMVGPGFDAHHLRALLLVLEAEA
jgi:transposase-like protein